MPNFNSPLAAFLHWEAQCPDKIFLTQPINGQLLTYTFAQAGMQARAIAAFLSSQGFSQGSHIALLSKNCAHWVMADLAIMMSGHVSIPIYPTLNAQSVEQILTHSESKAVIVGKLDDYSGQQAGVIDIPRIGVAAFGVEEQHSWEDLVAQAQPWDGIVERGEDQLQTIIYTSGTTGNPKGVMHTVGNFMTSISTLKDILKLHEHARFFSYLPLAHVAERLIWTYALTLGGHVRFPESLETFAADLEATQPEAFFAVPRIWTKFQEKILEKIPQKKLSTLLSIPIISGIIKSKLQKKLGLKHSKITLSAAAPLSKDVIEWYQTIGIEILQVYGMTEDCCISHFNLKGANKVGTVGKPLPGVKVKFSPEGEILLKNDCLMKGYFKAPEMTSEVLDAEGYLHTGDMGEYDYDGYLSITGRAKDQFKTDKGKYIAPAPIELIVGESPYIEQICIVGTSIPQPIGLVVLSEHGNEKPMEELIPSLEESIAAVNPRLEKHERIEKIVVMKDNWSVENGLMTPTLKLRRNRIEKRYQSQYPSWFGEQGQIVFER